MNFCVIIPCFNHGETVVAVALAAQAHCPVLIVDDGSSVPLENISGCTLIRLERNSGKGAALCAGFKRAQGKLGYSHAITMDADRGQHFAEDLPKFIAVAQENPDALGVGVRDFHAARLSGAAAVGQTPSSTFWFRSETGVKAGDSQCGFQLLSCWRLRSS